MKRFTDKKGFTLIELAIVLVIIGIILGAVLKGQDLIEGAKHKKFISRAKAWEVAQWTYLDRRGRFAGDTAPPNGRIDQNVKGDLTGANFINPPYEGATGNETNTISMGSSTFYVYFGTDGGSDTGKNVMIICAPPSTNACDTSFDASQIEYLSALDTAIDGSTDGTSGQFIGVNTSPTADNTTWLAYYSSLTPAPFQAGNTGTKAAVYYFDTKR